MRSEGEGRGGEGVEATAAWHMASKVSMAAQACSVTWRGAMGQCIEYTLASSRMWPATSSSGSPTATFGIQLLIPVCRGYRPDRKQARLGEHDGWT